MLFRLRLYLALLCLSPIYLSREAAAENPGYGMGAADSRAIQRGSPYSPALGGVAKGVDQLLGAASSWAYGAAIEEKRDALQYKGEDYLRRNGGGVIIEVDIFEHDIDPRIKIVRDAKIIGFGPDLAETFKNVGRNGWKSTQHLEHIVGYHRTNTDRYHWGTLDAKTGELTFLTAFSPDWAGFFQEINDTIQAEYEAERTARTEKIIAEELERARDFARIQKKIANENLVRRMAAQEQMLMHMQVLGGGGIFSTESNASEISKSLEGYRTMMENSIAIDPVPRVREPAPILHQTLK